MKHGDNKRTTLLRAAGEVVRQSGADAMTLEAVAARAGVSKGGLLYHFPTKEALIGAMVTRLIEEFDAALDAHIARETEQGDAPQAGRWLRAYARVSTTPDEPSDAVAAALMVASAQSPALLEPMKAAGARWQARAENDGLDPDVATVVRLAADGCWLSSLFGFEAGFESRARLESLQNVLLRLVEQATTEQKGETP